MMVAGFGFVGFVAYRRRPQPGALAAVWWMSADRKRKDRLRAVFLVGVMDRGARARRHAGRARAPDL